MTRVMAIWEWAEDRGAVTNADVREAFGIDKDKANVALRNLCRTGAMIYAEAKGKHGRPVYYYVATHLPPPGPGGISYAAFYRVPVAPERMPLITSD